MFGDSEEATSKLRPGFEAHYVSWDELTLPEGSKEFPDDRPWDLGAILEAGTEKAEEARVRNLVAFFLKDDSVGCHVLFAPSEEQLVEELLRVGAELEVEARAASPGLPGFAG